MAALALVVAALLALPLSWLLVARYRRAVVAAMGAAAPAAHPPAAPAAAAAGSARVQVLPAPATRRQAGLAMRRLARTCLPAGAVYAAIVASGVWLGDDEMTAGLRQWLVLAWIYAWPALMVLLLLGAADARARAGWLGLYLAGYALVLVPVVATNGLGVVPGLLGSWLLINLAGTLLVALVFLRRVRSAGPLVLALLLAMAFAAQALLALLTWLVADADTLAPLSQAVGALGLSARQLVFVVTLAGLVLGVGLAWPLLRWLGRRYQARAFSDQSLLIDALFGIYAFTHTIGPAATDARWYLLGLGAFVAARLVRGALQRAPAPVPSPVQSPARALLLLRVFRLGPRSEALFDRLRRLWLPHGPLRMIAGPDLAAATAAPHELLDWLAGRLSSHFVADGAQLAQRLQQLQAGTDPDGRHRVDTLFCRDQVWRDAVLRLAAQADAVLMDLRSYGRGNDGCAWEIGQLLHHVPLQRVLLLVDGSTDRARLQATLDAAAATLPAASPNAGGQGGPVRLMVIDEADDRTAAAVCETLLAR